MMNNHHEFILAIGRSAKRFVGVSVCLLGVSLLLSCFSQQGECTIERKTTHLDGSVEESQVSFILPANPSGGSSLLFTTNCEFKAEFPATQSVSAKEKEKQQGKTDRLATTMQWACVGLLLLTGLVAGFLPNFLVSNKTAMMIMAVAGLFAVLIIHAPDTAPVMKWVLPAGVVGAIVFVAAEWHLSKES
jgi:hypothetical protein